jgi:hypothetical protein
LSVLSLIGQLSDACLRGSSFVGRRMLGATVSKTHALKGRRCGRGNKMLTERLYSELEFVHSRKPWKVGDVAALGFDTISPKAETTYIKV